MGVVQGLGLLFDHGVAFVRASPPSPPLPLSCCAVVMWLLAPVIHVSSGLQGWGWVLGCHSFVPPSSPLPVIVLWCGDVAISTCDPPHKQWLAGLGQMLGCRSWHGIRSCLPPSLPSCHSICDPPHEQLLMGLGAGGVLSVVVYHLKVKEIQLVN
jgi:hypothetical protein